MKSVDATFAFTSVNADCCFKILHFYPKVWKCHCKHLHLQAQRSLQNFAFASKSAQVLSEAFASTTAKCRCNILHSHLQVQKYCFTILYLHPLPKCQCANTNFWDCICKYRCCFKILNLYPQVQNAIRNICKCKMSMQNFAFTSESAKVSLLNFSFTSAIFDSFSLFCKVSFINLKMDFANGWQETSNLVKVLTRLWWHNC